MAKVTGKRKAGRPPATNPRAEFIGLKVTREERDRLEREAGGAGLSLSEFIMRPHRVAWTMEKKPANRAPVVNRLGSR